MQQLGQVPVILFLPPATFAQDTRARPQPCPHPHALTGCPEPGLEQKMVYLRMMPLGFAGGSQETTTLLAEDGTALMPAGGPGTEGARVWQSRGHRGAPCTPLPARQHGQPWVTATSPRVALAPCPQEGCWVNCSSALEPVIGFWCLAP